MTAPWTALRLTNNKEEKVFFTGVILFAYKRVQHKKVYYNINIYKHSHNYFPTIINYIIIKECTISWLPWRWQNKKTKVQTKIILSLVVCRHDVTSMGIIQTWPPFTEKDF